jgi:hypothetical protein
MVNLTEWLKKYVGFAILGSLMVFVWGLAVWFIARDYQPELPVQRQPQHVILPKPEVSYAITRYQSLLEGSLFFSESVKPAGTFQSRLVLWGLINNHRALVGVDPGSNQNTWIVKAGDSVEGEQIVAVGVREITVRNASGEGKVRMSE